MEEIKEQEQQQVEQQQIDDSQQTESQEQHVPLSVVEELRKEMQDLKRQNFMLQQQLMMQEKSNEEVDEDPLSNLDPDDVLTVRDFQRLMQKMQPKQPQVDQRLMKLHESEQRARMMYPDYDQKIERLIPVVQQNPALREAILNAPDPAMLAYQLSETLAGSYQSAAPKGPQPAQNLEKPGTAVRSGGAGAISPEDRWLTMSPEEFEQEIARIKRGG